MAGRKFSVLGSAIVSDVRELTSHGVMFPLRQRDPFLLIVEWGGALFALKLTGPDAFSYFPISIRTPHEGVFVSDAEVLVDFSSTTVGRGHDDDHGMLILEKDQLMVIGKAVGDSWADGKPVPLWTKVIGGSESAKAAFTRWAIGVKDGDQHRIIWEHDFEATAKPE